MPFPLECIRPILAAVLGALSTELHGTLLVSAGSRPRPIHGLFRTAQGTAPTQLQVCKQICDSERHERSTRAPSTHASEQVKLHCTVQAQAPGHTFRQPKEDDTSDALPLRRARARIPGPREVERAGPPVLMATPRRPYCMQLPQPSQRAALTSN